MSVPRQRLALRVRDLVARHQDAVARAPGRRRRWPGRASGEPRAPVPPPRPAAGPYLTIPAGGPLGGVVTLTRSAFPRAVVVEARWDEYGVHESVAVDHDDEDEALATAAAWVDLLAAGFGPALDE